MENNTADILKAGALFINENKELMLSRDKGSTKWQVLGGKIESGETSTAALKREIKEELDAEIEIETKLYNESPVFPAANDPNKTVKLFYYFCKFLTEPRLVEEVEELKWFSKSDVENGNFNFSESTRNYLLPLLINDKILQ